MEREIWTIWMRVCRALAEEMDANYYNFMLYKERQTVFTNDLFEGLQAYGMWRAARYFQSFWRRYCRAVIHRNIFYDSMEEFK